MKENASTLAMLAGIVVIIAGVCILGALGFKTDGPVAIGLVSAITGLAGGLAGHAKGGSDSSSTVRIEQKTEGPPTT